jgi:activator of HSP90 ATPase
LYNLFLDATKHGDLVRSPVTIAEVKGAQFEAFGGDITGKVIGFTPEQSISLEWEWHIGGWTEGHASEVVLTFETVEAGTLLTIKHAYIPADLLSEVKGAWKDYYWMPLGAKKYKKTLA